MLSQEREQQIREVVEGEHLFQWQGMITDLLNELDHLRADAKDLNERLEKALLALDVL